MPRTRITQRQVHAPAQRLPGRNRFCRDRIDLYTGKLQVRGDGTGNRRGGQQQCQQQCRVVVVVQRPQQHRDQQGGDEQPETRGQHIDAMAVEPLRQRFGPARTCQQP
ncbi:hypothetical protein G6F60_015130 [Rhizopus arrhizus]|nr:hypothetical protein G6F60_015130 [Rhizopus arrhizus]